MHPRRPRCAMVLVTGQVGADREPLTCRLRLITLRRMRRGTQVLCFLLLALITSCTGSNAHRSRDASHNRPGSSDMVDREHARMYSVVAHLDRRRDDGQLVACASSGGVAGPVCGGGVSVPVSLAADLPRNAMRAGQTVGLTGHWDGHLLLVTGVNNDIRMHVPRCVQGRLPAHWNRLRTRLSHDKRLRILWFAPCSKDRVTLQVLALDPAIAADIRQRYGPAVHAYGWMTAVA
jgi:hypothetical protein